MSTAYINIGSNMGNRNALIKQAIAHIEFLCNAKTRKSPYVESEPRTAFHKVYKLFVTIRA